jgi:hypothetical protein
VPDRLDRILREILILNDKLMEVVSQEVSATVATMAVINSEERALGPFLPWSERFALRSHNV